MSSVDFEQSAEDHCRLLILVKQVGCHLKPKSLNFVHECISKVKSHEVASPPRTIHLKYLKQYQRENSEWGDFQAHRKVLGLVCIGKCNDENEVSELYKLHEDLKEQYSGTLYDSRLILLGLKQDGSAIEKRLRRESSGERRSSSLSPSTTNDDIQSVGKDNAPKIDSSSKESSAESTDSTYFSDPLNVNALNGNGERKRSASTGSDDDQGQGASLLPRESGTAHIICYPGEENCAGDLELRMQEFVLSLFWVLESKRLDRRSLERQDRMALLTAPFEKKDMVGVDTDTRMYRKRCQGRLRKFLGDLCLLAGVPSEAVAHYQTASDILRSSADWLWLGAAYEGICAATVIMANPPISSAQKGSSFQRNSSFSTRRGVAAQNEISKLKTATLGRNFSNGIDMSELRSNTTMLPDDIIDKYRETVQQYAKFRNAGVVEMECSLKACRVLQTQDKYLAAADFLQNVVYINIQMTEDEKTSKFSVLAELYDELGMHRKAGFFRRICAMQSVVPSNPKQAWQYCYNTLLQALNSYHLSLDPKEQKPGIPTGWPLVQLRVLHELIYSARKMGNPAIAIRHLTYLLHTMMEHLSTEEIKDMASILESYTSRCEGTPQALALEDGTILPPVPLLKFPTVKTLKLLNLPPHLRPVKLKTSNDPVEKPKCSQSPFIYSPLQIFKQSDKNQDLSLIEFCWVQGDMCETSVAVSNPLPFELHCSNLGLLSEGIKYESYPSSLSLPAESGPFHVKMTGVPKESGSLVIHGYTTNSLGVRSHCRLRDMPQIAENQYTIKVVPSLPQLQLSTSLPKSELFSTLDDSDSVVTSACASLYAGERCECNLRMVNVGKQLSAEMVSIVLDSKVDHSFLEKVLQWNEENLQSQLPLKPDCRGSLTLYINGISEFVLPQKLKNKNSEASQLDASPTRGSQWPAVDVVRSPVLPLAADGSWCLEALLRLQYTGGEGLKAGYCRHCSVALNVEIKPSVRIADWELHPASSSEYCVLVFDVENATSVDIELDYSEDQEKLVLEPASARRFGVEIPKCNILSQASDLPVLSSASSQLQSDKSQLESALQQIVSSHVCDAIEITWTMPSIQRTGSVSLESLWWSTEQLQLIQMPLVQWDLWIDHVSVESSSDAIVHTCGHPLAIEVQVTASAAICDVILEFDLRPDVDQEECFSERNPHHSVCLLGADALTSVSKLEENATARHSCSVVFLSPGLYIMDISCTGKTPPIAVGTQVGEVTERWSYTPSVKFKVKEDEVL